MSPFLLWVTFECQLVLCCVNVGNDGKGHLLRCTSSTVFDYWSLLRCIWWYVSKIICTLIPNVFISHKLPTNNIILVLYCIHYKIYNYRNLKHKLKLKLLFKIIFILVMSMNITSCFTGSNWKAIFYPFWEYRGNMSSFKYSQALHRLLLPSIINCISFKPSSLQWVLKYSVLENQ